jgi:hypothetical protein
MIQNLSGRASRYTYPAVERMLPNIQTQVLQSIEVAAAEVNRKLKVI